MTNSNPSGFKLDGRTIGIIALIAIAAIILLPQLLGGNKNTPDNTDTNNDNSGPTIPTANSRDTTANDEDGIELGNIVTATNLDRNGCSTDTTNTFDQDQIIYVVAENSQIAEGTHVFVRFYYDNAIYEESEEIVADQDYASTCVAFTLEPDSRPELRAGEYEAEFIVNGNAAESVTFEVQ